MVGEITKQDRTPLLPLRHAQGDFFVCDIFDAAPKGGEIGGVARALARKRHVGAAADAATAADVGGATCAREETSREAVQRQREAAVAAEERLFDAVA